ncbi:unnamed protein product [Acanthoscelides obtectus]|uniref:Uncharacterized protein n=1 Tax=Acanthoscelides obtectus TaxID=200917 RepID=A0A9P0MEA4_ACAOB|nr:unnamed protein product [Acanthoscelides obtectus]CAK1658577.1 hypothetical protein AOBTE_LOCUS21000 [Acanthoscelides obtectus]
MRLLRNYSDCFFLLCLSFYVLFFWFVEGADAEAATNSSALIKSAVEGLSRGGREYNLIYARLIGCAVQRDTRCFVDIAEDFLENKRNELLAQADREILQRVGGRADQTNTPSQLAKSIEKIIFELSSLFKNGIGGLLSPRDGDEELEDEEEEKTEDETKDGVSSRGSAKQEYRLVEKKKKKKPLKQLFRVLKISVLAAVVAMKVFLLVRVFEAALKFKLLMLALVTVAFQGVKLYLDIRSSKQHHHEEGIVFRNPLESGVHGGDTWSEPGVPGLSGEYHGRNLDGQHLAYSKQRGS